MIDRSQELVRSPVPPGVPPWGGLVRRIPLWLLGALWSLCVRLPATSPLRRRALTDSLRVGVDMLNRRALADPTRFYDPACELHTDSRFAIDARSVYRGAAGWREMIGIWDDAGELRFEAHELLDMGGPCFTLLVSVHLTGAASGVAPPPIKDVWTYTVRRGLILRQDVSRGWEQAPAQLASALARVATARDPAEKSAGRAS